MMVYLYVTFVYKSADYASLAIYAIITFDYKH